MARRSLWGRLTSAHYSQNIETRIFLGHASLLRRLLAVVDGLCGRSTANVGTQPLPRCATHRRWTGAAEGADEASIPLPLGHHGHRRRRGAPEGADES